MVILAADPPSGYRDVTTGSSPLVRNDSSKASANSTNLAKMIAQGACLYFPPGTYWINKTVEISKANVTLWGDEGAIICRTGVPNTCADGFPLGSSFNATANFMITANNFKMHGLTIKYDVPTSFTGVITAKSGNSATVRLTDGQSASFSADVAISRVNYFDENLRPSGDETFSKAGSKLGISNLTEDADGVKSFKCTLKGSSVGQKVAMACGSNYAQNIIIYGSSGSGVSGTVFEDVTVANSFGMVMLVNSATNLTLDRLRVDDGNPDTIYTTSVDGIHVNGLAGKLTMRDCVFNGLADDMLNVHCKGAKVGSVSGTTVALSTNNIGSVYFQKNHTVRFYSAKFADLGTATISSVTTSSGNVLSFKVGTLPSGVAAGCYIANESWLPEVEITGTTVGVTRARGFLLQTDKQVTIADCTFENTRLAGILCAPGASWGEMGPANGVTITNCTFRGCGVGEASTASKGNAAITVRCDHDKDTAGAKTANRNVWVGDCFFEDCTAAAVGAVSVTGLVVTNNVFLRCGGRVPEQDSCMVRLRVCDGAKVVYNTAYGGGFTNDVYNVSGNTNIEAHDNGFRAESEWGAPPVLPEYPVLGTPAVSRGGNGTFSISVSVSSNAPASVVCVDRGNTYPMATADTSLPATYSAVLSELGAGTHQPSVRALASNGTPVSATCPTAFHVGPLAVAVVTQADGGTLTPGVFRVSRADADPSGLPALSFDVAFSGAGLAAVVPPGVLSATIPADAAFVDIPVTPAHEVDGGLEIVMSVSGAYVGQASSATMTIRHTDLDATIRYVAEDGDDANDGVSPQQPKRTVANAVESLAAISRTVTCTVLVAPGTYTLAKETDDPITVTNAIRVVGTGATPEDVVVQRIDRASANHSDYRNYQDLSLFHLNHPDALVANLVLNYGSARQPTSDTTAGSAWIGPDGGTISNCVVRGGEASHPYAITPGILMLGPGLVTHCVITNNVCSGMEASWAKTAPGSAVVMKGTGGRLENCLIRDNRSDTEGGTGSDKTSTVYATGSATIANCTIVENRARNCAGVFADGTGVTVRNCVVAGNVDVGAAADNPNWMGTGTFAACATDDAEPVNGTCYSGSLAAFFPRLAENVPVALKFRPAAGGPLCDLGVDYEPMAGVDLSGVQPRKIGAHVDIGCCEAESGQTSGYAAWIAANGISGGPGEMSGGIANAVRYAFDIAPGSSDVGDPIIKVVRDAAGNPVVLARALAGNRDDVTFGVLATENLTDWTSATLVPMEEFSDGFWKPTASESSNYVFPAKMFFKYTIVVR